MRTRMSGRFAGAGGGTIPLCQFWAQFLLRAGAPLIFLTRLLFFFRRRALFEPLLFVFCGPAVFAFSPASAAWRFDPKNVASVRVECALPRQRPSFPLAQQFIFAALPFQPAIQAIGAALAA